MLVYRALTCVVVGALALSPPAQTQTAHTHSSVAFAAGVDVSELLQLERSGARYSDRGVIKSPFTIFHNEGVNWMRVRLFVNPINTGPLTNDLPYTIALARRIKKSGFKLLLDIHYSDGWADPHQQSMPKAWAGLSHEELVQQVRRYTREAVSSLVAADATPDMVEIGNEISNGMLWEDGRVTPTSTDSAQWARLSDLLKAGVEGVKASSATPKIMIHIDKGGDVEASKLFYDHILAGGVHFDVIGLSDYPWWQGTLTQLRTNLTSLANAYGKPLIVVETGFPWVPQSISVDGHDYNALQAVAEVLHFPATPTGQADYMQSLINTIQATPNHLGAGVFYWAAAWIPNTAWGPPPWSKDWEQRALFDSHGNVLPALRVLGASSHQAYATSPTDQKSDETISQK